MFFLDFAPLMSRSRFEARGAKILSAVRLLEFSVYAAQGHNAYFLLADGIESYAAFRSLVPPRVCS